MNPSTTGVAQGLQRVVSWRRQELPRVTVFGADLRDPAQQRDGSGIGEGEGKLLGVEHAHGPAGTATERAGGGIGSGISQLVGGGKDPLAQLGSELVRSAVGVGDGGA
jgi:hypothetical protein